MEADYSTTAPKKAEQLEPVKKPWVWVWVIILVLNYTGASLARLNATGVLDDALDNAAQDSLAINPSSISIAMRFVVIIVLITISFLQAIILRFFVRLVLPTVDLPIVYSWFYLLISYVPLTIFSYLYIFPAFTSVMESLPHIVIESIFALIHTTIYLFLIRAFTILRGKFFLIASVLITGLNVVFVVL